MIIWKDGKHIIWIKGKEKHQVDLSKTDFTATPDNIAKSLKTDVGEKLKGDKYHTFIHIFSKDSTKKELNYMIWLGPVGTEPFVLPGCKHWWERPGEKEVADGKNI